MTFSSKHENDYESQLEQIAGEVDSYIVKTDGALKHFKEQIKPLAQRWKVYYEAVDKREKELSDHWELVKKNFRLQDKEAGPPKKGWEWDRFYLHGLGSFGSNPINEMPAKYAPDVMVTIEKCLERNEKNEQGYSENSSEYKRLQEGIAEQRQNLEDIRSEFDKLSSAEKKSVWIKTPPKTVIPNKTYVKFMWWRHINLDDELVFGCWRPPLTPLPERPLKILKPVESGYQRNQTRKGLLDARNPQEEYERYYIFLSSVHDNYLQGVEKITEGIWLDILPTAVLCCLDKGHGDKTAFLKAALERICQSNNKTDKKKEQDSLHETSEAGKKFYKTWQFWTIIAIIAAAIISPIVANFLTDKPADKQIEISKEETETINETENARDKPIVVATSSVEVKIAYDWDFNGRVANSKAYLAFVKGDKTLLITSSIGYTASQTGNDEVVYKAKLDMDAKDSAVGNPVSFLKDTDYIQIEFGRMPSDSDVLEGDAICTINNSVRLEFSIPPQKLVNNRIFIRNLTETLRVLNEPEN